MFASGRHFSSLSVGEGQQRRSRIDGVTFEVAEGLEDFLASAWNSCNTLIDPCGRGQWRSPKPVAVRVIPSVTGWSRGH